MGLASYPCGHPALGGSCSPNDPNILIQALLDEDDNDEDEVVDEPIEADEPSATEETPTTTAPTTTTTDPLTLMKSETDDTSSMRAEDGVAALTLKREVNVGEEAMETGGFHI